MAFGNAVTDVSQTSIGTYGYTVRIDTTTILAYRIKFVQAQDESGTELGTPSDDSVILKTLQTYLEQSSCPDIAFNYAHGVCTVFFKTTVWPYADNTRFALFGQRNALAMIETDDKADFPDSEMELFIAYAIREASILNNKPVPSDISRTIMRREYEILNGG